MLISMLSAWQAVFTCIASEIIEGPVSHSSPDAQGICVLAGCDFLPSIKGVGPAKAHNLIKRYPNPWQCSKRDCYLAC